MRRWMRAVITLIAGAALSVSADSVLRDITFNDGIGTTLSNVDIGAGSFAAIAEVEAFGATDGSGSMVWSNMVAASKSSYANLGATFTTNDLSTILRSTVRIEDFDFDGSTANNQGVGFGIGDGSKIAYMYLKTGGTGTQMQLKCDTPYGDDPQATLVVDAAGVMTMNALGWTGLQLRMDIDIENDTFSTYYIREGVDADWQAGSIDAAFGLSATGQVNFVELDKIRMGTWYLAHAAENTISVDQWTIETISKVPPPEYTDVELEKWTYTGVADGTALNGTGTESDTGTGTKWNASPLCVISNELQRWEADGVTQSAFQGKNSAGASNGLYQVSFDVVSADFSNTQLATNNPSAQIGYGFKSNAGNKAGTLLLQYNGKSGQNQINLNVGGVGTTTTKLVDGTSISNLHVRGVFDLDAKTLTGYYSFDGGVTETAIAPLALDPAFAVDQLRLQVQTINGNNNWQPGDVVEIDNLTYSRLDLVPETGAFIAGSVAFTINNEIITNETFATLDVEAGDYVAVAAAGNNNAVVEDSLGFSGSATLGTVDYDTLSAGARVMTWYAPVLSNGTVEVTLNTTTTAYTALNAYAIRASTGDVDLLTTASATVTTNSLTVTNVYEFAAMTNGLVIEAMSSYGVGRTTDNTDFVLDSVSTAQKREIGHIDFESLSSLTNTWTGTELKQGAVMGLVFVEGDGTEGPQNPTAFYDEWLADNDYPEDAEMSEELLLEYASGSAASLPVSVEEGGFFIHVHTEWADAAGRGLTYEVAGDDDLVNTPDWTGVVEYVGTALDTPSAGLNTVTNRVPTTDGKEFIRLNITFTP